MKVELFGVFFFFDGITEGIEARWKTEAITATCFKAKASVDGDKPLKTQTQPYRLPCQNILQEPAENLSHLKWDTVMNSIKFIWFVLDFCPLLPLNSKMQIESLAAGYLNHTFPPSENQLEGFQKLFGLGDVLLCFLWGARRLKEPYVWALWTHSLLDCVLHYWLSTLEEPQSVLFCVFWGF